MNYFYAFSMAMALVACETQEEISSDTETTSDSIIESNETEADVIETNEDLVVITGDKYQEFYPGKNQVKFEGPQDEQKRRHGQWSYYSETGLELSTTMYEHGKKHGHSIVKYANGAVHYTGAYDNDEKVGVWKSYSENGELQGETDFGEK